MLLGALLWAGSAGAGTEIEWAAVGNPGNAADATGHGAVAHAYAIGVHEVTNAQYAEFLNAVADSDLYTLYNPMMSQSPHGGIERSGEPGSYRYTAKPGAANWPVNFVSFFDALRFANWLHNGRPDTGSQTAATTEDGAYTFASLYEAGPRKPDARVFLPSEDEWYKAAYYDAVAERYFAHPAGADERPRCAVPADAPNTANCGNVVGAPTDVGAYSASPSPHGTFDQGGNLWEWNESNGGHLRGTRGGSFNHAPAALGAAVPGGIIATNEKFNIGFRVAAQRAPGAAPAR